MTQKHFCVCVFVRFFRSDANTGSSKVSISLVASSREFRIVAGTLRGTIWWWTLLLVYELCNWDGRVRNNSRGNRLLTNEVLAQR